MDNAQYTVGIDEVGRGPLAGPVTVCAVLWLSDTSPSETLVGIRDSKKTAIRKREMWRRRAEDMEGKSLRYCVRSVDAETIDAAGISRALSLAAKRALRKLAATHGIRHVYADYGLPLPPCYAATHLVRGDEHHPLISLASIIAKTERDAVMCSYANLFPMYGFERHKGYGTQQHREAIMTHGVTSLHRQSFLKNIPGIADL